MEMMARSVFSVKEMMQQNGRTDKELAPIKSVLDSFYTIRIGIRILLGLCWCWCRRAEQHLSLEEQMRDPIPGYTGIINRHTNPYDVAQLAMFRFLFLITV